MSRNRTASLLVAGLLLVGQLSLPGAAQAEPASPLYELVDVAAQRLSTADPVAAYKWINGGPITDPQRAGQVLDAVGNAATAHGIDQQYVRTIFGYQIDATEGIEYTRFAQWKFDPATAPMVAPDLAESRSAIDGFNKTMVDEIALQWDSLHSPHCAADLTSAKAAVVTALQLDALYQQALSSATKSYCQLT